jgi:hypothetical protein
MSNKKVTKEELDKLVAANRMYRDLKFAIADIEMSFERLKEQKTLTMEQLKGARRSMTSMAMFR